MTLTGLRRWFERPVGGSWGAEPGEDDVDSRCIRGTDIDFGTLRADSQSAPLRSFSKQDIRRRSLRTGDIVIEKSGGGEMQPVGRVGLVGSTDLAVPTNFAARLRPRASTDPRFAAYALASLYYSGRTMAAVKQTTGIQNLDLDDFLANRSWLPPLAEQRAIADYLDAETTRIDALVAKKRQLIDLLRQQWDCWVDEKLWAGRDLIALGRLTKEIVVGIVVQPATYYVEPEEPGAVPAIRAIDVGPFSIDASDLRWISDEGNRLHRRSQLRNGDVVVVRTGNAGAACLVDEAVAGANCISNLVVRCGDGLEPSFVEAVLNSARARAVIRAESVGAIQQHFGVEHARRLPVPVLELSSQRRFAAEHRERLSGRSELILRINSQIGLLAEHRQALITAAVTGGFAVPGAA